MACRSSSTGANTNLGFVVFPDKERNPNQSSNATHVSDKATPDFPIWSLEIKLLVINTKQSYIKQLINLHMDMHLKKGFINP